MAFLENKLCIKWDDFHQNISATFRELRADTDFSDVTLVGGDGQEIEAHRVIISASSIFLLNMLKNNKHNHPMIYMRGIKGTDLQAVLDFMYYGEANVNQDDLNNFLSLAEELQIKSLCNEDNAIKPIDKQRGIMKTSPKPKSRKKKSRKNVQENIFKIKDENMVENTTNSAIHDLSTTVISIEDINELDGQISSMMQKMKKCWGCSICGKTSRDRGHIVYHIESKHIIASHPCDKCGKVNKTRNALAYHTTKNHNNVPEPENA